MSRLIKHNDDVFFENEDGERTGPYKTKFCGDEVIIYNAQLDVKEGDYAIQPLPNGKEKKFSVIKTEYSSGSKMIKPHFTVFLSSLL